MQNAEDPSLLRSQKGGSTEILVEPTRDTVDRIDVPLHVGHEKKTILGSIGPVSFEIGTQSIVIRRLAVSSQSR